MLAVLPAGLGNEAVEDERLLLELLELLELLLELDELDGLGMLGELLLDDELDELGMLGILLEEELDELWQAARVTRVAPSSIRLQAIRRRPGVIGVLAVIVVIVLFSLPAYLLTCFPAV